jgi:uncharacterized protein YceH (UPF0502 family)
METILNEIECRVLGSLVEKELATPEYYPLTLNSLTMACNQKSNRHPMMKVEESVVVRALDSLKIKHLVLTASDSGRVPKYRHLLYEKMKLEPAEQAVIAELLVRGPQTVGELKGRTERMAEVGGLATIEALLDELAERDLVIRLPRRPGMKEQRYAHLFSGEPIISGEDVSASPEQARLQVMAENERLSALEEEVRLLREEVVDLRKVIEEFKGQFE